MNKQSLIQEIVEIRKNLPKGFCPNPFTTIILEPDGQVGLCRNKGHNFPVGHLKFGSINEIWDIRNSEKAQEWRREFLEGKHEVCKTEIENRKCNMDLAFNELLPHAELKVIQDSKIIKLTANLNGKCNMQCPFCDVWQLPNGNYTDYNFWNPARESLFPFLKEIDMLSGEPFIQTDTYKLIDIVSEVNPNCRWNFTTNMNWTPTAKVLSSLDKIDIKGIGVSIDSFIDELYHRLRYPGKISTTLKNLDLLLRYRDIRISQGRGFQISLNFLTQKDNYREISEMYRFSRKNKMEFFPALLYFPEKFSLLNLSPHDKREVVDFIISDFESDELLKIYPVLMPIIESLDKIDKAYYLSYISPGRAI